MEERPTLLDLLRSLPYSEFKATRKAIIAVFQCKTTTFYTKAQAKSCEKQTLGKVNKILEKYGLVWKPEQIIIKN